MAITFGSLRHTTSGRKRKPLPKAKQYTPEFKELETKASYRRETPYYPSAKAKSTYISAPDNSYKIEESKDLLHEFQLENLGLVCTSGLDEIQVKVLRVRYRSSGR